MTHLLQTLYHQNPFNETQVPGIDVAGEDVQLGGGGVILGPVVEPVTGLSQFFRVNKTAGTSDFFANAYRGHNWLHPFLDPAETWPYIMRLECLCIADEVGASNRFYFGIVDFTTPASPTTIVGVGFFADTGGNWTAFVIDQTTSHLVTVTSVDANTAVHLLRIDVDGALSTVTFFIDGKQVAARTMPSGGLGEIGYPGASLAITQGVQGVLSDGSLFVAAGGSRNILSFVSDEEGVPPPVISARLTYQRILNLARMRDPTFQNLVIDDQQIMDELNVLTLDLIQEGSDADHSAFQEVIVWSTDVLPALPGAGDDLRDFDNIFVPTWVNSIYAVEGIRSSNKKIEIAIVRKEVDIRDRGLEDQTFLIELRDPRLRKPVAFRVWDPNESAWRLVKDEANIAPGSNPWADIVDANLIVSGARIPLQTRADLTATIPVPYRAMRPLVEACALILGGRAGKDRTWMNDQRAVQEQQWTRFREYINMFDMATDEGFDPEIGLP